MPDNKHITHPEDAKRIDIHDLHEIRNWCQAFGCTVEELKSAVDAVGTWAKDVTAHLNK
ncbi:Protein of unknown function [Pseudomonas sp. NFACC02]|uniref:DUF3606 domain-containing protein n=1 Tax=Pseudomonas sp. NFACC02 TaxID=1566250 RepID=UPI0008BD5421|nr:DUF3606 domain-containing protein [Pseudomonas sp. NFACC02]SEQ55316.1 Protein of unknown function [Pseudomonas sp. NFACC02]